jgi:F-type H+-transporting ATPase subunit a
LNKRLSDRLIWALIASVISLVIVGVLALASGTSFFDAASSGSNMLLADLAVLIGVLWVASLIASRNKLVLVPNRFQSGLEIGVQVANSVATATAGSPAARRRSNRGLIILGIVVVFVVVLEFVLPALHIGMALPVISVPGEQIPGSPLTNTLVGTFIADVLALGFAFLASRSLKDVPGRLQNVFEILVETLYNFSKQLAGPFGKNLFPLAATVFLFVLCANWVELVPGVDSIGVMECATAGQNAYPANGAFLQVQKLLDPGKPTTEADNAACESLADGTALTADQQKAADLTAQVDAGTVTAPANFVPLRPNQHVITSYVRAAATDLNLTLMLAVLAFCTIQYYGFRANGYKYLYKYINVPALRQIVRGKTTGKRAFGVIDVIVGFFEGISEVSKILSFGFRLFGNIFAGQALLFVMPFLIAAGLPIPFYLLEAFVGFIQAFVFALLIMTFTGSSAAGLHTDEEHAEEQYEHAEGHPVASPHDATEPAFG